MRNSLRNFVFVCVAATFLGAGPSILAADKTSSYSGDRVLIESGKSFDDVNAALVSLVAKNGMMVMAEVDQGKMLSMTGLSLKAKLFLIGNPTVGKQLFEPDHAVGLYVPLRVFVFTDAKGTTFVSYDKASAQLGGLSRRKLSC